VSVRAAGSTAGSKYSRSRAAVAATKNLIATARTKVIADGPDRYAVYLEFLRQRHALTPTPSPLPTARSTKKRPSKADPETYHKTVDEPVAGLQKETP
jgi:hypothetical protein